MTIEELKEQLSQITNHTELLQFPDKLVAINKVLLEIPESSIASRTLQIKIDTPPLKSLLSQLKNNVNKFNSISKIPEPNSQQLASIKPATDYLDSLIAEIHDGPTLLEIEKAILISAIQTDEVKNNLQSIKRSKKELKSIRENSEELLGNINDAKLIKAYTDYKNDWETDEKNARCHFWISAIAAAILIIITIAVLGSAATKLDLPTPVTSLIMLAVTGFGSFVVAVFSGNFKHARFLRTYYHHLSISTLFYKNFIQDNSIDSTESKAKEVARLKILELASKFPENKFDGSSDEDHLIKGSISEIAKAVRGK